MATAARPDVADALLRMADEDQRLRRAAMEASACVRDVDATNTARLREIVAAIGWPTRTKVGVIAEHRAWLLLQHADADRAFQRACLELMRAEPAGEVCAEHVAYLEDRLAVAEGLPQRYGTQLRPGAHGFEPFPIDDPDGVDERRASLGLAPLAEYVASSARALAHAPRGG